MLNQNSKEFTDILLVQGVNAKGYGMIPKLVVQDKRLTIEAKGIYSYFCSYAGAGTQAFPTVKKILSDLCIGETRYYKHLKLLKDFGYIRTSQNKNNGKFTNTIYTLCTNPKEKIIPSPQNDCTVLPSTRFEGMGNECTQNEGSKSNSIKSNSIKSNITTTCENKYDENTVVVDKELVNITKKEIDKKINSEISKSDVKKLISTYGIDKVNFYIDNWDKFKCTNKNNVIGFFKSAVKVGYKLPKGESAQHKVPSNMNNFEQREYATEDFEKYYYKVEGC